MKVVKEITKSHYPSQGSFLDPQKTKDGKPYGPIRYEELVRERYLISKTIHTSYTDTGKLTPTERNYILHYMLDEMRQQQEKIKELKEKGNRK